MKSNYKKLWPYIREIDIRNTGLNNFPLLWVSVKKEFIASIANTIGTDFTKYKIVKRNQFTYIPDTSRRWEKIWLAMLEDIEEWLVSQAYTVFEVVDKNLLLPEYLMMWFRRPEFDRYARFKSHGSVREIFDWEEMCDVELPIPDITEQRAIVDEYHVIQERIRLNETMILLLEDTAKALYREWFVDYEFPDDNGKPYKSSGGVMEYSEELGKEVPKGWEYDKIGKILEVQSWYSFSSDDYWIEWKFWLVSIENVKDWKFIDKCKSYIVAVKKNMPLHCHLIEWDLIFSLTWNIWRIAIVYGENFLLNQRVWKVKPIEDYHYSFLYFLFRQNEFRNFLISISRWTAQLNLSPIELQQCNMTIPKNNILYDFNNLVINLINQEIVIMKQNSKLSQLADLILAKMASVG